MENAPHMVEQVIKYSDGSQRVIKYRGVIVDGVLTPDVIEEGVEESALESAVEEAVESPVSEETEPSEEASN